MVKVLSLVSYPFLPAKFGGQKAIALFYKYLSVRVSLTCITTQENDPAAAQGYPVLNTLSNSPVRYLNIFYFFTLRKLIRKERITHLLLEHPYFGWLGVLLQRFTGVKLVIRSHNIEGLRWKSLRKWWWKILWRYEKWVHRRADHSFFIQEADLQYAVSHFRLSPSKCSLITYGIEWQEAPVAAERQSARADLCRQHKIPAHHQILLFNGTFDYLPNLEGLTQLLERVYPLLQKMDFPFTLIICGRNIPKPILHISIPNLVITGFVEDIDLYFKGADLFVNPVTEGGGIKTKLVEALAADMNAVSVQNGAAGVDPAICGGKLVVTENNNWPAFAEAVVQLSAYRQTIPAAFFQHFYWGNIAGKAAAALPESKQ